MAGEPVEYDAKSEVRFAVVLYGGVSLAVYMNGIVQELFELVRATAPKPTSEQGELAVADADLSGSGRVYRELGRRLRLGSVAEATPSGPVCTRFVVDIITGTSAGGINGVVLAKALANDQSISSLSHLWASEGDIDLLLNDDQAMRGLNLSKSTGPPLSLLSGDRMLYLLLRAIDGVSASGDETERSPYADEIDLWVTATDLVGRPERINLTRGVSDGPVTEADHRTVFHFVYDGRPSSPELLNQFTGGYDPMLAFAARCTSSFPGAFEPVQLTDLEPVIDGVRLEPRLGERPRSEWYPLDSDEVAGFFNRYGRGNPDGWKTVSFADGGYLNNRPVDLILQTLPKRRATLPVARRILLIEPDPGAPVPEITNVERDRTGLFDTVLKVVSLPRKQTIGGVVEQILALRGPMRTRNRIYAAIDDYVAGQPNQPNGATSAADSGYRAFRLAQIADDIGLGLARVGYPLRRYDEESEQRRAATRLVEGWFTRLTRAECDTFVRRIDLAYQLRRINFVQGRAGRLMRDDPEDFAQLRSARQALDVVGTQLAQRGRSIRFRGEDDENLAALRSMMADLPLDGTDAALAMWLAESTRRETLRHALHYFADELSLDGVDDEIDAALEGCPDLGSMATRFDEYDAATYAMNALVPGENDDIEIVRVSPRDTDNIRSDSTSNPKLAGAAVHHFGAFFNADWRRNDILWGRLDGAERLIASLWPANANDSIRRDLITRAQLAIVVEALSDDETRKMLGRCFPDGKAPDKPTTEDGFATEAAVVFEALKTASLPPGPPAETTLATLARAARVSDRIGSGLGLTEGPGATVSRWVGRGLRLGAGIADLALPNRIRSLVGRHLLDVAIVAAVMMIVLGGFVGGPSVSGFGWTVLFVAIALKIVLEMIDRWLEHPIRLVVTGAVAVALVGFAAYAAIAGDGWARAVPLLLSGIAVGLTFATAISGAGSGRRVLLISLAALLVVLSAIIGIHQMRSEVARSLCTSHPHDWYTEAIVTVLVESCPPADGA